MTSQDVWEDRPPELMGHFAVGLPAIQLPWMAHGEVTVESAPVLKRCSIIRLVMQPAAVRIKLPKGREWWGKRRRRQWYPLLSNGEVLQLWSPSPQLVGEPSPWQIFGPTSFIGRLVTDTLQPGDTIKLAMRGYGLFQACAIVEMR